MQRVFAVAAVLLFAAACSSDSTADSTIGLDDVVGGDCINIPDTAVLTQLEESQCDIAHDGQVFALFDAADLADEFPGADALTTIAQDGCLDRFEDFVAVPYETSNYFINTINPSEKGWADSDREIICLVVSEDGSSLTEDFRGVAE